MISERYIERDGERVLWRIAVGGVAALDVLTDHATLNRARCALEPTDSVDVEERLGTFGPFAVILRSTGPNEVAVAIDGPDLGNAFRGDQAVVFYLARTDLLAALQVE